MPTISVLVRIQDSSPETLAELVQTFQDQTASNWELFLLAEPGEFARAQVAALLHPNVLAIAIPEEEPAEHFCNDILEIMNDYWVGFMGPRDRLHAEAIAEITAAIGPNVRVIYTDEQAINRDGLVSLRFTKGAINGMRLRAQDYLRNLTVIQAAWLRANGGFDRMATDVPRHDVYLRIYDQLGPQAFVNIPRRLFWQHRNHADRKVGKVRRELLNMYDKHGIEQHLTRRGIIATVRDRAGTAEINYQTTRDRWVTLLVVDDGSELMAECLQTIDQHTTYRPLNVQVIQEGSQLVDRLNQAMFTCDTELVCLLQGLPLTERWLEHLVSMFETENLGVVGTRLMNPVQTVQPGLLDYRFEGWDWNTAGRFNEVGVPHQVSAVSPHAMLIDTRLFRQFNGFNADYPTLYGMDLCLRLDSAGYQNILNTRARVMVSAGGASPQETATFRSAWSNWSCRFGLHTPPQELP